MAPMRRPACLALAALGALGALARPAAAAPGIEGTRNLALGDAYRASASGPGALLGNPAAMSATPMLAIDPLYQVNVQSNTHGVGLVAMDSLNNRRFALGLGYAALIGGPRVRFADTDGATRELALDLRGHEVGLGLAVNVIKGWLSIGVKPKYQRLTLRHDDPLGASRDANAPLSAFGLDAGAHATFAGWASAAVVGYNLSGAHRPAYTAARPLDLSGHPIDPATLDASQVSRVAEYPRALAHAVAVYPLRRPIFSLNLDGLYDFTSYRDQGHVRLRYAMSAEFVLGKVALRAGGGWDRRGRGRDDDRGHVAGGVALLLAPATGRVGADVAVGVAQQVAGPHPETVLAVSAGLRFNPGY